MNKKISHFGSGTSGGKKILNYFIVWLGEDMPYECSSELNKDINKNNPIKNRKNKQIVHCINNIVHNIQIMSESIETIINCHIFCDNDFFYEKLKTAIENKILCNLFKCNILDNKFIDKLKYNYDLAIPLFKT